MTLPFDFYTRLLKAPEENRKVLQLQSDVVTLKIKSMMKYHISEGGREHPSLLNTDQSPLLSTPPT